jgi:hypothetical protein
MPGMAYCHPPRKPFFPAQDSPSHTLEYSQIYLDPYFLIHGLVLGNITTISQG